MRTRIFIFIFFAIICYYIYKFITFEKIISDIDIKASLINLKKRPNRLTKFKKHYNLQIPYEIVNAVDGSELNLEKLYYDNIIGDIGYNSIINTKYKNIPRKFHYELGSLGAVGCTLSHMKIWNKMINENIENMLIFEDDCKVDTLSTYQIYSRLKDIQKQEDWDILLLISPNSCYEKEQIKGKLYKVNRFFQTHAYIIRKKGARFLMEKGKLLPINQQLDSHLSSLACDYGLNIYIYNKRDYFEQLTSNDTDIQTSYDKSNGKEILFTQLKI